MGRNGRMEASGAIFTERCDSLDGLRCRGGIVGRPTIENVDGIRAIVFDGASQGVDLVASEVDDIFDGGATLHIKLYIHSDGENNLGRAIYKTQWGVRTVTESGGYVALDFFRVFAVSAGVWTTAVDIPINTWVDVIITYDSSSTANDPTIYIDGVARTVGSGLTETSSPSGALVSDSGDMINIGHQGVAARVFDGAIADIDILPYLAVAAEASKIADGSIWDYDDSLVSAWDMSEVDPQDVGWPGNGNDGTGSGLVASTDIVNGPYGNEAVEFNGTNESVTVGSAGNLSALSAFTVVVTSKLNAPQDASADSLVTKWDSNSQREWSFELSSTNGYPVFVVYDETANAQVGRIAELSAAVVDEWAVYAATWDGGATNSSVGIYKNKDKIDTADAGAGAFTQVRATTADVVFGARLNAGTPERYLNGSLADVRLYCAALTTLQVADLCNRLKNGGA